MMEGCKFEDTLSQGRYNKNESELGNNNNGDEAVWTISGQKKEERVYTYDEAIDLTGNGWYTVSLLITLALTLQAMALDMFGFSVVVTGSVCDLQLDHRQANILLCMPLLGSIAMAYPWGYFSDTQGRKKSLMICLWGSFLLASLSAFSPNWIVLAVLKFFATSFSSGAHAMSYTLLGESCSVRLKAGFMIIITCSLMFGFGLYMIHGYVVLNLDFAYNLGFIIFTPWRLLVLTLASTLCINAIMLSFFYESPKFLVNAGRTEEALEILRMIRKRNKGDDQYPVKKVVLTETSSFRRKDVSLMESLRDQTMPLFKPPLLRNTLILFYITAVVYSANNGFFLWLPMLMASFYSDNSHEAALNQTGGFCDMIASQTLNKEPDTCKVSVEMIYTSTIQGTVFVIINCLVSFVAHRRRTVIVSLLSFCTGCCLGLVFTAQKIATLVLFFGFLLNCVGMGILFSYFVDLFPTSYRGMVSCLGVVVARASALSGVNLVGAFIFSHCDLSLYAWGAVTFSGAMVALLLPPDLLKKT